MRHVFCMSIIKIVGRNFVVADHFYLSSNNNNKVRRKLNLRVSKNSTEAPTKPKVSEYTCDLSVIAFVIIPRIEIYICVG